MTIPKNLSVHGTDYLIFRDEMSVFTRYHHGERGPDSSPESWSPGLLFRRWTGSSAVPAASTSALDAIRREWTPRETTTKSSKNCKNKSLKSENMDSLSVAIGLQEETEVAIQRQYLKTFGDEISSLGEKATLASLTRHFRLEKLNDMLMEVLEMEYQLERWHDMVRELLPNNFESYVQGVTKKLEEVARLQNKKWVSVKAALDVQYCMRHSKYLETKIAHFHDTIEETLTILHDLVERMDEGRAGLKTVPQLPFSKLSVHQKIVSLPERYVACNTQQVAKC